MAADSIFDSEFLAKLEQLYLLSRKIFRGQQRAERRSRQIGASLEFADYRNYVLGDDLRSIDWNIYGRLDRLFVKLFEEEQDLQIYILVDSSESMRWKPEASGLKKSGNGRLNKLDQARRIAASLAYIGLSNLDRVNIFYFSSQLDADMGLARGKSQFHKVLEFLKTVPGKAEPTRLSQCIKQFTQRIKRRGLVFVISDFFDPAGYESALALLRHHQFEIHVLQLLAPEDIDPPLNGDLRLTEPELGETLDITISPVLLKKYRDSIDEFQQRLTGYCQQNGLGHALATTAVPFEELVLKILRQGRLVA